MMKITFKPADATHLELLLEMIRDFYVYEHLAFDEQATPSALRQIIGDASFGRVYLILSGEDVAGYIVLTFGFSLEHHGRDAFIDEIYLKQSYRGRGIGTSALKFIEDVCRKLGIRALHLEVERANTKAQAVYRRAGYVDHDRYLMTRLVE